MITEDQTAIVEFLASASTHGGQTVDCIDTHASCIFLAGPRAYKLKRAVRFDYLDFSTSERRRLFCEAELRLNQRTAPSIYRRVVSVTREPDGSLALNGSGVAIEWLVEMNRFPQEALFDRLAAAEQLDPSLMSPLAEAIAAFHGAAERRLDHGGTTGMAWVVDGNAAGFAEFGTTCLDEAASARLIDDSRRELHRQAGLLDSRRESGSVRECHGDLHLRNIVLLDGRPTLFDGVEFNDEISCTDVFYDLAFLLMDLWRRRLPRHANALFNRYLRETADRGGVALLPLFLSCRAAVRAKTSATAADFRASRAGEVNSRNRRGIILRWQGSCFILLLRRSSRLAAFRDRASRPWRSAWRPSSAPCPVPSCFAAMKFVSSCAESPPSSAWGPQATRPEFPTASIARWPSKHARC